MYALTESITHTELIKNSRFIVRAAPVSTVAAAMAFIETVSEPDATHNCWAYRIADQYRFSDDGEPGGTAGRPIFAAIEQLKLTHVVVVVTRYFGGVKLGAGGLSRAYGNSAAKCLQLASKEPYVVFQPRICRVGFDKAQSVHALIQTHNWRIQTETWESDGVYFTLLIPESQVPDFEPLCANLTSGNVVFL